ncbi:MAG: hypothetical protein HYS09_08965 [Chloroflexi bacterium]|nr:hypothetical protein [Chloroflexota bacterium]
MITEKDEERHPHTEDGRWRESLYWDLVLPEEGLGGVIYLRLTPATRVADTMLLLYQGHAQKAADCPYVYAHADQALPASLTEVTVGHFGLRRVLPLMEFALSFNDGQGTALEAAWRGRHRPFDYAGNRDGCPQVMGVNRFEQTGHVTGRLSLKGKEMTLREAFSHRDHSWGIRDWAAMQHYKWVSFRAGEVAANLFLPTVRGESALNGYLALGEDAAPLADVQVQTEYDAKEPLRQRAVKLRLRDEKGREVEAEGESFASVPLPSEGAVIYEAAASFSANGKTGEGVIEYLWPQSYVEHLGRYKLPEG